MVDFTVNVDGAMAREAAKVWYWQMFRKYRAKQFALSLTIFAIGTGICFWYFGTSFPTIVFAVLFLFNLLYIPLFYFAFQLAASKMAKETPEIGYCITESEIKHITSKRSLSFPLSEIQQFLVRDNFFVIIFSRYGFWCLPKAQTPHEAVDILQST